MLVSKKCLWHNQALVSQNSAWGAGNCYRSQEKVYGEHELMSTKLWHVDSLHLVFPLILAKEWRSHLTWGIFDWNWITLNSQLRWPCLLAWLREWDWKDQCLWPHLGLQLQLQWLLWLGVHVAPVGSIFFFLGASCGARWHCLSAPNQKCCRSREGTASSREGQGLPSWPWKLQTLPGFCSQPQLPPAGTMSPPWRGWYGINGARHQGKSFVSYDNETQNQGMQCHSSWKL